MYCYVIVRAFSLPDGGVRYRESHVAADSFREVFAAERDIPGCRVVCVVRRRRQCLARS